jgi:beta-glucosidase-like glycosyl hydrolase
MGEGEAAVRALLAGCDVLLYPEDPAAVIDALRVALASGRVSPSRFLESVDRIDRAVRDARVVEPPPGEPALVLGRGDEIGGGREREHREAELVGGAPW